MLLTTCRNPAKGNLPNVALMQRIPPADKIVAYFDFVFKVGFTVQYSNWLRGNTTACYERASFSITPVSAGCWGSGKGFYP